MAAKPSTSMPNPATTNSKPQTDPPKKSEPDHQLLLLPSPQDRLTEIQLLNSLSQLDALSSAIHKFRSCFHELTNHLNFIEKSLVGRTAPGPERPNSHPPKAQTPPKEIESPPKLDNHNNNNSNNNTTNNKNNIVISEELVGLCNHGKALRRYITKRIKHVSKIQDELLAIIKASQNPGRLVLDCIGKFYVQGKKAIENDPGSMHAREVTVLVLEAFLVASEEGGIKVEKGVRWEAEQAAGLWVKRLGKEGGFGSAGITDVRGLVLLVAGFGVLKGFGDDVVLDLVRSAYLRPALLRKSRVLIARVSDILERMMKKDDMKIEIIDIVIAFGVEDKFPLEKMLTKYLQGCDEAFNRRKRESKNDPILLKEANEGHLNALESALKFIEDRKLDSMKLPPEWQLKEMISKLKKEHADLSQKMHDQTAKRKAEDVNELNQETKQPQFASKDLSVKSLPSTSLRESAAASHVNEKIQCNVSTQKKILDGGVPPPINGHAAAGTLSGVSSLGSTPNTEQHVQIAKTKEEDGNELNQETKRPRFASKDLSVKSSTSTGLHENAAANHVKEKIQCDGSMKKKILDGRVPCLINGHAAAETLSHMSSPGSSPNSEQHDQIAKRKAEDKNALNQEIKRPRFASKNLSVKSSSNTGLHGSAAANHANEKIRCNGSTEKKILDVRVTPINGRATAETLSHLSSPGSSSNRGQHEQRVRDRLDVNCSYSSLENSHPTSETTPHESGASFLPRNDPGLVGAIVPYEKVVPLSMYDGPSTGFLDGVQRQIEGDTTQLRIGSIGEANGRSCDRDAAENDWPGQSLVGHTVFRLFWPSSSIERFVGFPNFPRPGAAWSPGDLYRFVDDVVEMEYGRNSIITSLSQPVTVAHRSSCM